MAMDQLILPRRRFLLGLGALLAAPAVVRAESLMPIFSPRPYRVPYVAFKDARVTFQTCKFVFPTLGEFERNILEQGPIRFERCQLNGLPIGEKLITPDNNHEFALCITPRIKGSYRLAPTPIPWLKA